jgi:hypothetical protein
MAKSKSPSAHETLLVDIETLKPHPKNYRKHSAEQLEHITSSIKAHGFYRNVVCANDWTILAGHGVVEASKQLKLTKVPVIKLNIKPNDARALKVLTGDNEIARLGEVDDRVLSELLRDVFKSDEGLLGTGFDPKQLANFVFVTRPASEIADFNAALEWVGLPAYDEENAERKDALTLSITFPTKQKRVQFVEEMKLKINYGGDLNKKWSTTWPFKENNDTKAVKFK